MGVGVIDRKRTGLRAALHWGLAIPLLVGGMSAAWAGPREQAKRMHDRLTGVPPSAEVLDDMAARISAGNAVGAALLAMENSAFYNVTLKNLATPWTNREQTVFAPLNDYTATVIGLIRDEADFRRLLYDDVIYVGSGSGIPAYSVSNNAHYEALEQRGVDLKTNLTATAQSSLLGIPPEATAGVMTSRAAAKAFFYAGTNRAMFRYTVLNHLCKDLEEIKDPSRPADRIRQDVSRSPGGDSRIFLNNCIGCHAGMDPLAQAYAYYDFEFNRDTDPNGDNGRLVYNGAGTVDPDTGTRVQGKYLINAATFKYGFVTPDDRWDNYWRQGPNALLGWDPALPAGGHGAKSMGQELAHSEAFARCQVEKVFKAVCLRPPGNATDRGRVDAITASFKGSNYNMKQVFAETAVYCMGE